MINSVELARQFGDDHIGAAVIVVVLKYNAHAGKALAIRREPRACGESALLKRAVTVVVEQVLLHPVVADENVREAVTVVIGECNSERSSLVCGNAGAPADVLEGAISPVAIKVVSRRGKTIRGTEGRPSAPAKLFG